MRKLSGCRPIRTQKHTFACMVLCHDQTEIFCEWNSQNAIKLRMSRLPPFLVSVCQGEIFFFRDVSTETGLTLICQQCLSWCHDRHTHTTWEAEFLFHPPSFLHIVVFVCCLLSALCIRVKLLEGVKDGRREVHEMSKRQRNGGVCFSETGLVLPFYSLSQAQKKKRKKLLSHFPISRH